MKRRPTRLRREGTARRTPQDLNFSQLRREVALLSDIGIILKESRQFRLRQQMKQAHEVEQYV